MHSSGWTGNFSLEDNEGQGRNSSLTMFLGFMEEPQNNFSIDELSSRFCFLKKGKKGALTVQNDEETVLLFFGSFEVLNGHNIVLTYYYHLKWSLVIQQILPSIQKFTCDFYFHSSICIFTRTFSITFIVLFIY